MATTRERLRPRATYDGDFYAWALQQAALIRAKRFEDLDLEPLSDEVEDVGKAIARELRSRYSVLIQHLLKFEFQPDRRSASWRGTIDIQRLEIEHLLDENPSLRPRRRAIAEKVYKVAVYGAVMATNLDRAVFPTSCPYTLAEIEDEAFWPGSPDA